MKRIKLLVAALLAAALLCPTLVLAKDADWPDKLTFGVIPTESSSNANERFEILVQYLEKRLGLPIEFKTSTDYAGVITGMQFKHVDFAYFGPKSYCEAAARANAEAFAIEVGLDGTNGYHGVIITKKGSGLNSLADIKGKVWAFTDPNSTSGTLVPTVFFTQEMKIVPDEYFSKVIYSGSHEASMLAVKGGKVDAASTNDLDMVRGEGKLWNKDQDFNIIWTSKLIPGSPMAYRKDLPASLKKALKDAFLAFDDQQGLAALKLSKYDDVADADYDPIRDLIEAKKRLAKK
ncbi:phosphonate ABC transporter substrate-binding protein [Desulfuromonas carbonis]|uniref:phosphonate ABC transporter substrate-binding protein n=1 Tax=Desulfuromonas sp. DDH964 TaxID=1823759 RepID=UPI00078C5A85|nr:phosphonate ABC transporter substrate-binding protein [Desulfuromonas sp. DDH964]AMV73710.1 ABC transporter substrate-binding lipoprotein [Desulfuromonas sp. DDH964]